MQVENSSPHTNRLENIEVVKIMIVKDVGNEYRTKSIKGGWDAASVVKEFLAGEDREVFLVMCLDSSHKINSINIVSIGTLDFTIIHPREIFKPAILSNAGAIIIAHNHPSGNPDPSLNDLETTRHLVECGKLLGIKVLDSIIIGDGEYTSVDLEGKSLCSKRNKFPKRNEAQKVN